MMADFVAHSEYLLEGKLRAGMPDRRTSAPVPRGMTGIAHIRSRPEVLRKLRAEIVEKATQKSGATRRLALDCR
jgi:hypothetical protein